MITDHNHTWRSLARLSMRFWIANINLVTSLGISDLYAINSNNSIMSTRMHKFPALASMCSLLEYLTHIPPSRGRKCHIALVQYKCMSSSGTFNKSPVCAAHTGKIPFRNPHLRLRGCVVCTCHVMNVQKTTRREKCCQSAPFQRIANIEFNISRISGQAT